MQLTEVDREDSAPEEVRDPGVPVVDAHHHLWPLGYRIPYDLTAMQADLARWPQVEGTVFVECMASFRADGDEALRPVGETEFVVGATSVTPTASTRFAAGIVGWADLMQGPDQVARTLDGHLAAGDGRFTGVRFNVVWHDTHSTTAHAGRATEPHMLLDERYRAALGEVAKRDLTYDVWLFHRQLPELAQTLDAVPDLTFVVDHLGGPVPDEPTPESRAESFEEWRQGLVEVGRRPNVVLKLGGVGMPIYGFGFQDGDRPGSTVLADAWRPYVETAIDVFGVDRCMFESNFPVDKQSYSYDSLWNAFTRLTTGCAAPERAALFSGTATRVYGLDAR
jgi:L-fuconolactonase